MEKYTRVSDRRDAKRWRFFVSNEKLDDFCKREC